MLGTNDAGAHHIPTEIYRSNMIQLTTRLKEAGIKKIILNEPIYTHHTLETATLLQEYSVALSEIADGETVFVGDTQAYESFEANFGAWFVDITHPNNTGHAELGKLRAAAFNRIMDSQVNPNHSFTGINESNHML
jgi:lysophospholipase L1-like esterase